MAEDLEKGENGTPGGSVYFAVPSLCGTSEQRPQQPKRKRRASAPTESRLKMLEAWEAAKFQTQEQKLHVQKSKLTDLERRVNKLDPTNSTTRDAPVDERPGPGRSGSVFNPYLTIVQANRGTMSVSLEKSVYTAAFISPLLDTRNPARISTIIAQYLGLLVTIAGQILFTTYIQTLVFQSRRRSETNSDRCNRGSSLLRFLCLCVLFTIVSTKHLMQLMNFRRWLRACPRWLEKEHRKIANDNNTYLCMKRITSISGENSVYVMATGISEWYRAFVTVCLVYSRIFLAGYMLIFCAGYVCYVENNEHVFLNTLTSIFIINIDSYGFEYLTSDAIKTAFDELPPLGFLGRQDISRSRENRNPSRQRYWAYYDDELWYVFGGLALIPLMLAVSAALFAGWCSKTVDTWWLFVAVCSPIAIITAFCFIAGKYRADTTDFIHIERQRTLLERDSSSSLAVDFQAPGSAPINDRPLPRSSPPRRHAARSREVRRERRGMSV